MADHATADHEDVRRQVQRRLHRADRSSATVPAPARLRGVAKKKKGQSVGQTIGGIIVGFDQQIFRTTPPVNELVAKGTPLAPVAASGGGTMKVGMPGDPEDPRHPAASSPDPDRLRLEVPGATLDVDLAVGGRLASLLVDGRELLKTEGYGPVAWGSFPMAPYAGRIRDGTFTFDGRRYDLPITMPPHAIHGTVLDRRWRVTGPGQIETALGPDWPFRGRVVQRFTLSPDSLTCRLEVHADEPMPASVGWHPWFVRRIDGVAGSLELELDAGAMYVRDAAGITTDRLVGPTPGPWDDCFTEAAPAAGPALAGVPGADHRVRLPGLGGVHGPRRCLVRGTADGAPGCAQSLAGGGPAGPPARCGDDLALAIARRLSVSRRSASPSRP